MEWEYTHLSADLQSPSRNSKHTFCPLSAYEGHEMRYEMYWNVQVIAYTGIIWSMAVLAQSALPTSVVVIEYTGPVVSCMLYILRVGIQWWIPLFGVERRKRFIVRRLRPLTVSVGLPRFLNLKQLFLSSCDSRVVFEDKLEV